MRAAGGSQSITLISQKFEEPPTGSATPVGVLAHAFVRSGFTVGGGLDPTLSPQEVVVIIGAQQVNA